MTMKMRDKTLCNRTLEKLRVKLGWPKCKMAARYGISRAYLYQLLDGTEGVSENLAAKILYVTPTDPPGWVLKNDPSKPMVVREPAEWDKPTASAVAAVLLGVAVADLVSTYEAAVLKGSVPLVALDVHEAVRKIQAQHGFAGGRPSCLIEGFRRIGRPNYAVKGGPRVHVAVDEQFTLIGLEHASKR
jgi:hypothetical protein